MKTPANIRRFNFPDDYPSVIELWEHASPDIHIGRSDTPEELNKKVQHDPDLFIVAELNGDIIGTVIGGFDGRRGMIYHLAVDAEFRGLGIGTSLMETIDDRLRNRGCLRSYLLVGRESSAGQFYTEQGWTKLELHVFGKDLQ